MGAQVPLVMALDDAGAVPGVVGGKGASLARLARAGFRVPPGFHVTTSAYRVVGCGNATMRLHTGDRVRLDRSHGTVEVLHQA